MKRNYKAGALVTGAMGVTALLSSLFSGCGNGNSNNVKPTNTPNYTPVVRTVEQPTYSQPTPQATAGPTYTLPSDCVRTPEPISLRDASSYFVSVSSEQLLTEVPYQGAKFRRIINGSPEILGKIVDNLNEQMRGSGTLDRNLPVGLTFDGTSYIIGQTIDRPTITIPASEISLDTSYINN